ncbi:uncharacterized protein LOC126648616 [Myiozetetes cayanensis]|uniref:uncharacterized protein LOC126648616 n=1 Tax=Myiozetetes cayanensis TaxID=478635 RepID=UPI0021609869|nr:uncharacterized protein LOC126648616 [Myiozetetes cayanensis]
MTGTTALFRVELDLRSCFIQHHTLRSRLGARKSDHSCSSAGSDATMRRAKLESSTFQLSMPSRAQVNSRLKPKLSQDTKSPALPWALGPLLTDGVPPRSDKCEGHSEGEETLSSGKKEFDVQALQGASERYLFASEVHNSEGSVSDDCFTHTWGWQRWGSEDSSGCSGFAKCISLSGTCSSEVRNQLNESNELIYSLGTKAQTKGQQHLLILDDTNHDCPAIFVFLRIWHYFELYHMETQVFLSPAAALNIQVFIGPISNQGAVAPALHLEVLSSGNAVALVLDLTPQDSFFICTLNTEHSRTEQGSPCHLLPS